VARAYPSGTPCIAQLCANIKTNLKINLIRPNLPAYFTDRQLRRIKGKNLLEINEVRADGQMFVVDLGGPVLRPNEVIVDHVSICCTFLARHELK
jgi:hypothetical protein